MFNKMLFGESKWKWKLKKQGKRKNEIRAKNKTKQ